jgi:hypothetical protein
MTLTQIKKELAAYLPLLSERQQEVVLDMVKNLLHIDKKEKRISLEKYNQEIEASVKQVREGKVVYHSEILKESKKWFKRK